MPFILNVLMAGNLSFAQVKFLKNYQGLSLQPGSIEGEQHVDSAAGLRGSKGSFTGYLSLFLALANQQGFSRLFIHQHTGQFVLLAHGQTGILHRIGDGDLLGRLHSFLAVDGGSGANGGLPKGHGLALILQIGVRSNHILALIEVLKDHHSFASKSAGIQRIGQFHGAIGTGGRELQLSCDLLLTHQQRLPSAFVHENAGQFVGFAHLQVFVGHGVHDGDFPGGFRCMFAIHRGSSADLRHSLELVINGAQLNHCVIPANGDSGHLHQLITLVSFAAQFLQGVLVEGKGAQLVLNVHHPALGGQAEPGTVVVIPSAFVLHTIVAVGVLGVGVPLSGGTHFTVFIGHHNMGFPSSFRRQFEGHIGEPLHIGFAALTDFDELQVSTDHLVVGGVAVPELNDLPILPDLEGANRLVRMEVPFSRLALHHLVGAVGQGAGVRLGDAVHHLDGSAHLAGFIQSAVHIHGVDGFIGDLKESAIQAGPTQGGEQAGLQVTLFDEDAASYNFIRHGKFVNHAIILHQDCLVWCSEQHTLVGGGFMEDVLTVRQQVISS